MGLNLKNPQVERLAREVADLAGESLTEAIGKALEERKARLTLCGRNARRQDNWRRFLERDVWPSIPGRLLGKKMDKKARERILGYGPEGV